MKQISTMKKSILILAVLCCSMLASAQIKSNVFGIQVGQHTKAQVDSVLHTMGMHLADHADDNGAFFALKDSLVSKDDYEYFVDRQYAGVTWRWIRFFFFNDKLKTIVLESTQDAFATLGNNIIKKYERYMKQNEPGNLFFTDGISNLALYEDRSLVLEYQDEATWQAEEKAKEAGAADDL